MMKFRIAMATIAGCMALAACGGGTDEANTLNADDNLLTDMNAGMTDMNMTDMNAGTTDMNATTDANAMGNMDMDATTNTDMNTTNTL